MPAIGETKRVGDTVGRWDGSTWRRVSEQSPEDVSANVGTVLGENYHPQATESPMSAMFGELMRTGGKAVKGFAKGVVDLPTLLAPILHPLDTLGGVAQAASHPIDTITNAVGDMVADPEVAGQALGTTVLADAAPGLALKAGRAAPAALSRGAGAVGRGMEAAGKSAAAKLTGRLGPGAVMLHPSPAGAAVSAAAIGGPPALRGIGKLLQKLGPAEEAATSSGGVTLPPTDVPVGAAQFLNDLKQLSPAEAKAAMQARIDAGPARKASLAGLDKVAEAPAGPRSTEIPYRSGEATGVEGLNAPIEHAQYEPVAHTPDLMDEFQATQGPKESFVQDTLDGPQTMRMDGSGSHVAEQFPIDDIAKRVLQDRADASAMPGNIRFNNAATNSPASLKALNDLASTKTTMPEMGPVPDARKLLEQVHANEAPSYRDIMDKGLAPARAAMQDLSQALREKAPSGAGVDPIDAMRAIVEPGEEVLSPLDRLSRLSQARARGSAFRNGGPIGEAY